MKKILNIFSMTALILAIGSFSITTASAAQVDAPRFAGSAFANSPSSTISMTPAGVPTTVANVISENQTQEKVVQSVTSSAIESLFSSDITNSNLRQIGYDFFSSVTPQGFGKYDGSYKLNIGEKVNVYFWGDSVDMISLSGSALLSPLTKSQIDAKGNLFVPGVGMVKADGQSISEVEKNIQSMASKKFTNVKTKITVADSTEFVVFVYGYVNKPGKVSIGNNSSIIEALAAAGGVNKNGSLRTITYKSNGKNKNVDLYELIFEGKDSGVRLSPNDIIYVNSIGSVVAVKNGVKIPGIYEVKQGESISSVIKYAGGLLPSTDKSVVNVKLYKNGERVSKDVSAAAFKTSALETGDILEFRNVFGKAEDFVTIEGNIKHPGTLQYKKGMRLSDVLKNKNELQDETFVHQAVIKRIAGDSKQVVSIPVSLEEFFNGGINPELKPQDTISVYKNTNGEFVEVYGCINRPKQVPFQENLTLKAVMADLTFMASTPEKNIHNVNTISNNNHLISADDVAVEIVNGPTLRTLYLYDIFVQNDAINIRINKGDKVFFRPLRDDEIVKTVKVSGYVNNPGVYKFVEGKKLTDMVSEAGGLSKDADLRGIVYKRMSLSRTGNENVKRKNEQDKKLIEGMMANDTNATKDDIQARLATLQAIEEESTESSSDRNFARISLNIKNNNLNAIQDNENIEIQDGDEIYIPKYSNHVMVIGEVYNETSFVYKKNAKASYYIHLVGGYTPNARRTKIYKVGVNGRAKRLNLRASNPVEPGDTIIVPRKVRGNDWIQPLASTIQSIAGILVSVFVVTKI